MENKIEFNNEYINTKYLLIKLFLLQADRNILDISYKIHNNTITIQVVILEGCTISQERIGIVKDSLRNFDVVITEISLTRDQFNEGKGEWQPRYYKWLDYLLFSKAEVL